MSGINEEDFFNDISLYENYKRGETGEYNPPSRDEVGTVYRAIKDGLSVEALRQKFAATLGFFKTMVAVDVLQELKLITEYNDDTIKKYRSVEGVRADLSKSKILEFLKG